MGGFAFLRGFSVEGSDAIGTVGGDIKDDVSLCPITDLSSFSFLNIVVLNYRSYFIACNKEVNEKCRESFKLERA